MTNAFPLRRIKRFFDGGNGRGGSRGCGRSGGYGRSRGTAVARTPLQIGATCPLVEKSQFLFALWTFSVFQSFSYCEIAIRQYDAAAAARRWPGVDPNVST